FRCLRLRRAAISTGAFSRFRLRLFPASGFPTSFIVRPTAVAEALLLTLALQLRLAAREEAATHTYRRRPFLEGLRERGWVEGQNASIAAGSSRRGKGQSRRWATDLLHSRHPRCAGPATERAPRMATPLRHRGR